MHKLRVGVHKGNEPHHLKVEISLDLEGMAPESVSVDAMISANNEEQEELRWYFEEQLALPTDTYVTRRASQIEKRIADLGNDLFNRFIQGSDAARDLWARLRPMLPDTRIEIVSDVAEANLLPWELIRDPRSRRPLALSAQSFVRSQRHTAKPVQLPNRGSDLVRILLVICRPWGDTDVPFRSVASRLVKGLSESARLTFRLDVLRPPTFEQLGRVLRHAARKGEPYHIVHFDGHGTYNGMGWGDPIPAVPGLNDHRISQLVRGSGGFLLFEHPGLTDNCDLVDGLRMGNVLAETRVPILVLNSCRSAFAEVPEQSAVQQATRSCSELEAYGSLAQQVMDAGILGVVAMRYNVHVETVARFLAELYSELAKGFTVGEATKFARNVLADNPVREVAYESRKFSDWCVPVVYEREPVAPFPEPPRVPGIAALDVGSEAVSRNLDPEILALRPDVGFIGRDEAIHALDRAFDTQRVVLLHAMAGMGKSATGAEFARWYAFTGGIQGPVIYSSFAHHLPLARLLDKIGQVFDTALEGAGVNWKSLIELSDRQRVAMQILQQIPVLWIWDNVEQVPGFPSKTLSEWSEDEQQQLSAFLRGAADTQAKFLLISRREVNEWLGSLPAIFQLRPMPMLERLEMARVIANRKRKRLTRVSEWRDLLDFTQGCPTTVGTVVAQVLDLGVRTRQEIKAFLSSLRSNEPADEQSGVREGRSTSLELSVDYGFSHSFDDRERAQLALLGLFRGYIEAIALCWMGDPNCDWCLDSVRGLTLGEATALLDRAAAIRLLNKKRGGTYTIQSALSWYFRALFEHNYMVNGDKSAGRAALEATYAFVEAMSISGISYHNDFRAGDTAVLTSLKNQENNLISAHQIACTQGWWPQILGIMQGLRTLYEETGNQPAWGNLVRKITPHFLDNRTDKPLPGREADWSAIIQYRISVACNERRWASAELLQRELLNWAKAQAANFREAKQDLPGEWRESQAYYAETLEWLGRILREQGKPESRHAYWEAIELYHHIGDARGQARAAFNLGNAYMQVSEMRDFDLATDCYESSLKLLEATKDSGHLEIARCLTQLGLVAHRKAKSENDTAKSLPTPRPHHRKALQFYLKALRLIPHEAIVDLAVIHRNLGELYEDISKRRKAVFHWDAAIGCYQLADIPSSAGETQLRVAQALVESAAKEARRYAEEALTNLTKFEKHMTTQIDEAKRLIARTRRTDV